MRLRNCGLKKRLEIVFVCRVVANYVLKEALGNGCLQVMLSKWFLYYKQLEINGYRI